MEQVLVVEDQENLRELYKAILEKAGYEVLTARDDINAFDLFFEHQPRVVIMDLNLGLHSLPGNEICKQLITLEPKTQVICVSGNFEMFKPDYGLQNGFSAVIAKPVATTELLRVVKESFDVEP